MTQKNYGHCQRKKKNLRIFFNNSSFMKNSEKLNQNFRKLISKKVTFKKLIIELKYKIFKNLILCIIGFSYN